MNPEPDRVTADPHQTPERIGSAVMRAQPFLKWAGGKRWLTANREISWPEFSGRYIEPFLGGAAVFFAVQPEKALLADLNADLINAYKQVKTNVASIVEGLADHQERHSKSHYYEVRDSQPEDALEAAVRFIYLNRTCWNGLYRVNRKGQFNVPIGSKTSVAFCAGELEAVSEALACAEIKCADFEVSIDCAEEGDFLFVDPPYTANHNSNGFLKYNEEIFSWADQQRLKAAVARAIERRVQIVLTNADHESVRELYGDTASYRQVWRASVLAGKASTRRRTSEALFFANLERTPGLNG